MDAETPFNPTTGPDRVAERLLLANGGHKFTPRLMLRSSAKRKGRILLGFPDHAAAFANRASGLSSAYAPFSRASGVGRSRITATF